MSKLKTSKKDIIKKILSIRLNVYSYRMSYKRSSRRLWLTYLCFTISAIVLSILFLLNKLENDLFGIKNNELLVIAVSLIILFIIYKVLRIRVEAPKLDKIYGYSDIALEKILKEEQVNEGDFLKRIVERIANSFAIFITVSIALLILIITKLVNYNYDVGKLINFYVENVNQLEFPILFLLCFIIGDLIGTPILPKNYEKSLNQLKNRIKNSFLINLYLSKLNPEMEDENN